MPGSPRFRLAIEDIEPNNWIAYALDLPGCFSAGATPQEVIGRAPERIAAYLVWRAEHDCSLPVADGAIGVDVVETFTGFPSRTDPSYFVNAFFADDQRPLAGWEIRALLPLFDWTYEELLAVIRAQAAGRQRSNGSVLPDGPIPAERAQTVDHLAGAENWYFANLGLGLEAAQLPADALGRLEAVAANTRARLPDLIGDERILTLRDERWSARKVVRRALWHRREHSEQVAKQRQRQG